MPPHAADTDNVRTTGSRQRRTFEAFKINSISNNGNLLRLEKATVILGLSGGGEVIKNLLSRPSRMESP